MPLVLYALATTIAPDGSANSDVRPCGCEALTGSARQLGDGWPRRVALGNWASWTALTEVGEGTEAVLLTPRDVDVEELDSDQESARRIVDHLELEALTASEAGAVYFRRLAAGLRADFFSE